MNATSSPSSVLIILFVLGGLAAALVLFSSSPSLSPSPPPPSSTATTTEARGSRFDSSVMTQEEKKSIEMLHDVLQELHIPVTDIPPTVTTTEYFEEGSTVTNAYTKFMDFCRTILQPFPKLCYESTSPAAPQQAEINVELVFKKALRETLVNQKDLIRATAVLFMYLNYHGFPYTLKILTQAGTLSFVNLQGITLKDYVDKLTPYQNLTEKQLVQHKDEDYQAIQSAIFQDIYPRVIKAAKGFTPAAAASSNIPFQFFTDILFVDMIFSYEGVIQFDCTRGLVRIVNQDEYMCAKEWMDLQNQSYIFSYEEIFAPKCRAPCQQSKSKQKVDLIRKTYPEVELCDRVVPSQIQLDCSNECQELEDCQNFSSWVDVGLELQTRSPIRPDQCKVDPATIVQLKKK